MNLPNITDDKVVKNIITLALEEDLGTVGDTTTLSLVPENATASAVIIAKESCVVSGVDVAKEVFEAVNPDINIEVVLPDGSEAEVGNIIMKICGSARTILTGERTALNFMQRMSGIASMAREFKKTIKNDKVMILDTRKTTPALRVFEKYAVLCGGGTNHRMGLYDRIMIKDNHRKLWNEEYADQLDLAVLEARKKFPGIAIEVEVETFEELKSALKAKPQWILLDNMSPEMMVECVAINNGVSLLEASGGITLKNVYEVAQSGVDAISLGCLTHSAPSVDLSLEIYI
ncbi:MAG: carboxylating nicotinate-nucleotide diphosphorylase [Kiritimatiellae bacterium]|jgi:nicotinate-nucleotide pyrophosphorylase (carboxylating)|nr:carboxylating nicotinate-nucleotide diphosphorylase [Kiritimatiellia bacterium]